MSAAAPARRRAPAWVRPPEALFRLYGLLRWAASTKPRVMVFTEHFNATYVISFQAPLQALQEQGRLQFQAYSQQDVQDGEAGCWRRWLASFRPDVVFFSRYGRADGAGIMADCRRRGIRTVYHIDDDLLNLPASLGAEINKRHGAAAEARQAMLGAADVIYTSTPTLAGVMRGYFPQQRVVNGISSAYRQLLQAPAAPAAATPTFGFMGSKGHKEDLALVVPAIERLLRERPALRFETFGTIEMPPRLQQFGERVTHHKVRKDYQEFLQTLASLGWQLGLAPLVDEPFNRCKAPIKFMEYTACGIPIVASDVGPYRDAVAPGTGLLVKDDWYAAIAQLLDDPQSRCTLATRAQDHCARVFAAQTLQSQLVRLIDGTDL